MAPSFVRGIKMSDWAKAVLYVAAVALFLVAMVNFANQTTDCDLKGGAMMKPAVGWYTCVKPVK